MLYKHQRRLRPRRKIDRLIDTVCAVFCLMPMLLIDLISDNFIGKENIMMTITFSRAASYALFAFVLLNLASFCPQVLAFIVPVTDDNHEKLIQIFNNMLNRMKLVVSMVVLYPIYTLLQLPIGFFIIIMLIALIIIGRLYLNNIKAAAESKKVSIKKLEILICAQFHLASKL